MVAARGERDKSVCPHCKDYIVIRKDDRFVGHTAPEDRLRYPRKEWRNHLCPGSNQVTPERGVHLVKCTLMRSDIEVMIQGIMKMWEEHPEDTIHLSGVLNRLESSVIVRDK